MWSSPICSSPPPGGGEDRGESLPRTSFGVRMPEAVPAEAPTSPSHPSLPRERGRVREGADPALSPLKGGEGLFRGAFCCSAILGTRTPAVSVSLFGRYTTLPLPYSREENRLRLRQLCRRRAKWADIGIYPVAPAERR